MKKFLVKIKKLQKHQDYTVKDLVCKLGLEPPTHLLLLQNI